MRLRPLRRNEIEGTFYVYVYKRKTHHFSLMISVCIVSKIVLRSSVLALQVQYSW